MSINFMKVHQPNMPAPEFEHKSLSKSKYADSVVENDTRIGRIVDKVRALGIDKNTYIFWTTDNGAWQDVYPDADTGRSAAPKVPCGKAATAFHPLHGAQESRRVRRTPTLWEDWTTWRPLLRLPA